MSSAWCLHERTKLGGDGGQWVLSRDREFTVGRSPESNIKSHSQSVENRHAVFSWDPKTLAFTLRDLGTVNGTYINNRPLRGSSVLLKHNDSIRFGYDKDRVFRIEECFSSRASPGTMVATQSPTRVPVSASSPAPNHSLPPPDTGPARDDPPVSTNGGGGGTSLDHAPSPAPTTTVEATPHGHAPVIPTIQHTLPTNSTEEEPPTSLPSPQRCDGRRSVDLEQSPARNRGSKLYGQPDWWGEGEGHGGEARDREFEFAKRPGSQILRQLDPYHSSHSEAKRDSVPKLSARDELRLQSLASPDPATSWVIDFGGGAGSGASGGTLPRVRRARDRTSRPRSADPSPNRLTATRRDHSPLPTRPITPTSSSSSSSTTSRSASFSVPPRTTPAAAGRRGQRATTPPLVRASETISKKPPHLADKASSPKRKTPKKPNPLVSTSLPSSPQHSKPPSPRKLKPQSPLRSKPPQSRGLQSKSKNGNSSSQSKPKTTQSETTTQDSDISPRSRTISPPNIKMAPSDLPHIVGSKVSEAGEPIELEQLREGGKMSHLVKDDETYTAAVPISSDECSSLSDHTLSPPSERPAVVVVAATTSSNVGGGGGEEGVAIKGEGPRKQWASDENESPDSLMIANIEARMRRLSRLAHQTARQVSALKGRIQEGCRMEVRGVDYLSLRDSSPVVTRAEQHLPEWRSFNKEAHSIFRNMRVVEKWLHDIDGTLSSIQPADITGSSSGAEGRDTLSKEPSTSSSTGGGEEGVDLASDSELYLDTIETTSNSEISD